MLSNCLGSTLVMLNQEFKLYFLHVPKTPAPVFAIGFGTFSLSKIFWSAIAL